MPSVLFVCTGNRYRSPLAAAVFSKCLEKAEDKAEWKVGSAGTWTELGLPADRRAVRDAKRLGLDLKSHRSRQVDAGLLSQSSLVLVMEAGQKEALQIEFPQERGKIHLLSEVVAGHTYDFLDSFDDLEEPSEDDARELSILIKDGFTNICALAKRC
jgi:protein-tyrosine phosphatase